MAKKRGTESELAELHQLQTQVYTAALRSIMDLMNSEDKEERLLATAALSPSLLNAINSFLKNNDITCQPELLEELTETEKLLRRKTRKVTLPDPDDMQEFLKQ